MRVVLFVFVSLLANVSHAVGGSDAVVDYLFNSMVDYRTCLAQVSLSMTNAEYESFVNKSDSIVPSLEKPKSCRKIAAAENEKRYKAAVSASSGNKPVQAGLKGMKDYWFDSMVSIFQSGTESNGAYKRRTNEAVQNMKKRTDQVMIDYCKKSFECIEEKGAKLEMLDQI